MQLMKSNHITVNVVDSIMGSGKTTWVLDRIKRDKNPKYIVVTPTLSEVTRIINECPNVQFKEPETKEHNSKYYSFKELVRGGENIVTTHALFEYLTQDILKTLKAQGYTLIIDEALSCVDVYSKISTKDLSLLLSKKLAYVEPKSFRLKWNNKEHGDYEGRFDTVKRLCDNGNLIYFKEQTMLWEFPIELLSAFKEIWALTYLFQGSTMANYLKADGTHIVMYSLKGKATKDIIPELIPYSDTNEAEIKVGLRSLITTYEGKGNDVGLSKHLRHHPLSSNWFKKKATPEVCNVLKKNLYNFFVNFTNAKSEQVAWTVFKSFKSKLKGKGYAKGYVTNNIKATNDYIERKHVAYVQNTFYHPLVKTYFTERNVTVYDELYSLSEMIQFIWRFQIRRNDPITVYIPSSRMRNLFLAWLGSDTNEELFKAINIDES